MCIKQDTLVSLMCDVNVTSEQVRLVPPFLEAPRPLLPCHSPPPATFACNSPYLVEQDVICGVGELGAHVFGRHGIDTIYKHKDLHHPVQSDKGRGTVTNR